MPVINIDIEDLERLVGDGFSLERFKEEIPMIGATVENEADGEVSVEFFPNRPDLFSVEGAARAYRRFSGMEGSDLSEEVKPRGSSGIKLEVDGSVEDIRPVIGAAYVRGVEIDEKALKAIMNLQEKLHITVGRKRRKVAIGIHDASPLKPPFKYWGAKPDEVSFIPLQKEGKWDLKRILEEHEKGNAYAWILEDMERYPVITDSMDQVLSFPPIINGELTKVTTKTTEIFVDCTGLDLKAVELAVNIVCSQLAARGGTIEEVDVTYPSREGFERKGLCTSKWPHMEWKKGHIDMDWSAKWLGKALTADEIMTSLQTMGYERAKATQGGVTCLIPPWRNDILHPADLAEDIAIGHGLERFRGESSNARTTGSERRLTTVSRYLRETMTGLGFLEVRTISLSNERSQFGDMNREEVEHMRLANPITVEHTMMRLSAIPSLISLLRSNRHRDLPQRLFETADIMVKNRSRNVLSAVSEDSKASFTEVKGYVQRLLQDLGVAFVPASADLGWYIKGRGAAIMVELPEEANRSGEGPFPELENGKMAPLGHLGEIHPGIIEDHELSTPVSAFEIDLDLLSKIIDI